MTRQKTPGWTLKDPFTFTCEQCMKPTTIQFASFKVKLWPFHCHKCRSTNRILKVQHHTHGKTRTPTYVSWAAMKQRCYDPNTAYYKRYGGRGITVCPRWKDSFENFLADMGERPTGMTLDRRDNSAGYSPLNCRWASKKTQAQNRRKRSK